MNKYLSVKYIVRTAMLLAITVVFQMLRLILPFINPEVMRYITSTLVNTALIVAAGTVGLPGACVIALIAPLVAFFQGFQQAPMLMPIMLGNAAVVVAAFYAFKLKKLWILGAGAVVKYLIIAAGMALFVPSAASFAAALGAQFVQLVTAVLGGVVAVPVLAALKRVI